MRFIQRFPTVTLILLLSWLVSSARADAATELDDALAKLKQTTHRKRDRIDLPAGVTIKLPPVVTEYAGEAERMIFDVELPSIGQLKVERITVDSRSATRTISPALVAKFSEMNRKITVSSAKNLLQQIVSAAAAVQTGGLSTTRWIMEAARAVATIKTTADARSALQRAAASFDSWQLVESEDDEDIPQYAGAAAEDVSAFMAVTREAGGAGTVRYVRRPTMTMPGAEFYSVIIVNSQSGLPVAEESYLNGKRMMRSEFFDVGAPIVIEVPECLK
jgi:hypothetical protein